jgi:hypothetical protein
MPSIKRTLVLLGLLLPACSGTDLPTDPAAILKSESARPAVQIGIMSQNLYVGTDVDAVQAALVSPDPTDDFPTLINAIEMLSATDFSLRAAALVEEIARTRPLVVGLQEMSRLEVDLTPLGLQLQVLVDFEPILYAALAARGLDYVEAAEVTNIDMEVLPGPGIISMRDKDVILVRGDADLIAAGGKTFDYCLAPFPLCPNTFPYPLPIQRGYVWAKVNVAGLIWTFVSAHPESGAAEDQSALRSLHVGELVTTFSTVDAPVVLLGDFNDRATPDPWSTPDAYDIITGAGYTDFWLAKHPGAAGLTCCFSPDLSNEPGDFYERIDFVFVRGILKHDLGSIHVVGTRPSNRIDGPSYPIWRSDHAGLAAVLLVPSGKGLAD